MHTEHFFVDRKTISNIKQHKGSIISVGTTTLRTLESLYWLGVKTNTGDLDFNNPFVGQWEPYNIDNGVSLEDSLDSMDNWLKKAQIDRITASTQLCIVPGYHFRVVDRLITNYHQPRSTLLLLVAAFIGEQWKSVYQYALENDFRFLSYGDSSLLYRSINNISK
jgi:S-adenosylmethionine:tRNA ribosyltransferase-isomerase